MAICFEVSVNGGPALVAGAEDAAVLSAILSYVAKPAGELEFTVGALVASSDGNREHLSWLRNQLAVGDQVAIRVIESAAAAHPVERVIQNRLDAQEKEREYYDRLRRKYEPER